MTTIKYYSAFSLQGPDDAGTTQLKAIVHSSFPTTDSDEAVREINLDLSPSQSHGIIYLPLRFPKFLAPAWKDKQWDAFLDEHLNAISDTMDEYLVQTTSLCIAESNRDELLRSTESVVIDVRGALWNRYSPSVLEGFKIGVYRSGTGWPAWLNIEPTVDRALGTARKVCAEAGLDPKKSIQLIGKAKNLGSAAGLGFDAFIYSSEHFAKGLVLAGMVILIIGGLAGWLASHFI